QQLTQEAAWTFLRKFILRELAIFVLVELFENLLWIRHRPTAGRSTEHRPRFLEVFQRERVLASAFEHLTQEPSRTLLRKFILRELAVFVLVEPLEELLWIEHRPAAETAGSATIQPAPLHRGIAPLQSGQEFFFRQFAVVVLVPQPH